MVELENRSVARLFRGDVGGLRVVFGNNRAVELAMQRVDARGGEIERCIFLRGVRAQITVQRFEQRGQFAGFGGDFERAVRPTGGVPCLRMLAAQMRLQQIAACQQFGGDLTHRNLPRRCGGGFGALRENERRLFGH